MSGKVNGANKTNAAQAVGGKKTKGAKKKKAQEALFDDKAKNVDKKKDKTKTGSDYAAKKAENAAKKDGVKSAKADGNTLTIKYDNGKVVKKTIRDDGTVGTKKVKTKDKNGKAKTVTTEYRADGKTPKSKVVEQEGKTTTVRYDKTGAKRSKYIEEGNKKTTVNYNAGKKVSKYIEEGDTKTMVYYQEDGKTRKSKEITSGEGENQVKTNVTYDANNQRATKHVEAGTGDNLVVTDVKYKDGVRAEKTVTGKVNGVDTTVNSTYDANNKISSRTTTTKDAEGKDVVAKEESWERNEDGTVAKKTTVQGPKTTEREYTYDPNDTTKRTVVIKTKNSETGENRVFNETQILDANGKVVSSTRTDETGKVVRETKNTYDENGKKIGSTITTINGAGAKRTETREDYVYGANGSVSFNAYYGQTTPDGNPLYGGLQENKTQYFDGTIVVNGPAVEPTKADGANNAADGAAANNGANGANNAADGAAANNGANGANNAADGAAANENAPANANGIPEGSQAKNAFAAMMKNAAGKTAEIIKGTWDTICDWFGFSEQEKFAGETIIDSQFAGQGDIEDDGVKA